MSETIIDVKSAVKIAMQYVLDLLSGDQVRDVRLEEVEFSDDGEYWLVTIGFSRPEAQRSAFEVLHGRFEREYREVKVLAKDGQVRSMRIRKP